MSKLKRCPFCGGEAVERYDNVNRLYIECEHGCIRTSPYWTNPKIVIETWNTRKPMERIVERLGNKHNESTINYHNLKDASCLGERHAYRNAIEILKEEGGLHEI